MKTKKETPIAFALLASLLFAGCAPYIISKKYRQEAAKNVTVSAVQQNLKDCMGKIVIWGGRILDLTYDSTGSKLAILESPLDGDGYPRPARFSRGRFIATTSQFLDTAIFIKGHKVTLAGEVVGLKTDKFGNGTYAYPEVKIEELRYWVPSPYYFSYHRDHPLWWDGWPYYDFYDDFFYDGFYHGHIWRDGRWEHDEGHHGEGHHGEGHEGESHHEGGRR